MYYVYAHYKKDDNTIFYIGVAKAIKRFNSKYSRNSYWKNTVNKHGFYYKIIFENEDWNRCLEKEKEFIKLYGRKDLGLGTLVNMTDGGEGCVNLSLESRFKIGKGNRGKKRSREQLINISNSQKGKTHSEESKNKMSISHKKVDKSYLIGRKLSKETIEKISNSNKNKSRGVGRKLSPKHIENLKRGSKRVLSFEDINSSIKLINSGVSLKKVAPLFNTSHNTLKKYIKLHLNINT